MIFTGLQLYYIIEVIKTKKIGIWKMKWASALLILGVVGVILYEMFGRKEIERE
ncbi:PLDc N-terminal domain-containing protein [Candidatus Micrarchaeota archaeon]|nr:PLDc N-terminal domain-containing protein [Candidatus Micrarchaeota archaeon]